MTAKRPVLLAAGCIAALISLPAYPDSMESAPVACRVLEVDYSAACGDTDNINSLAQLREANDCALIAVDSRSRWNASGLMFEDGVDYKLEVQGDDPSWCDASIQASPEGWKIPDEPGESSFQSCHRPDRVAFGSFQISLLKFAKLFSRASTENLFTLMGLTSNRPARPFKIGTATTHHAEGDGEFCSYANDTTFTYSNNSGALLLKVTRIASGSGRAARISLEP